MQHHTAWIQFPSSPSFKGLNFVKYDSTHFFFFCQLNFGSVRPCEMLVLQALAMDLLATKSVNSNQPNNS